jgi:hypothetical protein
LCLLVLLQSFSNLLILADYQLNKSYIIAELCINKSKPKMHCNGKCHLVKQLQKDNGSAQAPGCKLKQKTEEQRLTTMPGVTFFDESVELSIHFVYTENRYSAPEKTIFHPPSFQKVA